MSYYYDLNQYSVYDGLSRKLNNIGSLLERPSFEKNIQHTQINKIKASDSASSAKQTSNKPRCGTFLPQSGSKTYKTEKMNYNALFSSKSMYAALCQRKVSKNRKYNMEYTHMRQTYIDKIFEVAKRFKITDLSCHLAVTLMDALCYSTTQHNGKLDLYASASLLLAAKTIELDGRIPSIPKLRQVAGAEYSVEDYKKAEMILLENVDWNPQYTSVFEFVEFFLSQGVVYSSDGYIINEKQVLRDSTHSVNQLQDGSLSYRGGVKTAIISGMKPNCSSETEKIGTLNSERSRYTNIFNRPSISISHTLTKVGALDETKINDMVSKIEASASQLCSAVVRETELIELDSVVLSCACIAYLRKINRITPSWCEELEELTGVQADAVYPVVDLLHKHFDSFMAPDQNFFYVMPANERSFAKESCDSKNGNSTIECRLSEDQPSTADHLSEYNNREYTQTASQPCSLTSLDSGNSGSEQSSLHTSTKKNEAGKNFHIRRIAAPSYTTLPTNETVRQPARRATVSYRIQTHKNLNAKSGVVRPPIQPILGKTRVLNHSTKNAVYANGILDKQIDFQLAPSERYPHKRIQ